MTIPKIPIPGEFQSQLRYVEPQDTRSDAEILKTLTKYAPISSEKNLWTYWHAGVLDMPGWCQRNVINWVRILGPSWKVRVLDTVPDSPNHALKFISPGNLPESFVKGTMTGPYVGPHSADFLRGAALHAYGGVWMDAGIFLIRHLDRICWDELADDTNEHTICVPWITGQYIGNYFIAARKGDELIEKWHSLFLHFWKYQNDHSGIAASPLIGFVQDFKFDDAAKRGFNWDFAVDELTVLCYMGQVLAWVRCCKIIEPNGGFNGVEYSMKKVLWYDAAVEDWAAEAMVGFEGYQLFSVLAAATNVNLGNKEYEMAYRCIWRLLTRNSIQKITHGKNLLKTPACGVLLDKKENEGIDIAEGTFAELLRYGSLHFEQRRDHIEYVSPVRPTDSEIIHKGLFEP